MLHLWALRYRPGSHTRTADAGAHDHAPADGHADDVAAITEAYVAPDARADDGADQHGRRAAAARGRARRRGCCLRRLSPYLITAVDSSRPRPFPRH